MSTGADWKPGYSTIKTRYPYDGIESTLHLPINVRPVFSLNEETKRVGVNIDANVYPKQTEQLAESTETAVHLQYLVDFLMDRAFEFQNALKVAEDQVAELLSEDPFMPEQFGFKLIHEPEEISDAPIRLYQSTFNDKYSIHRPVANTLDPDWNPALWVLQTKNEDNTFTSEEVLIPCHRIGFAYFFAKNIQVMEKIVQGPGSESPVIEEKPVIQPAKGMNNYTVNYMQKEFSMPDRKLLSLCFENIISEDEKDAQSKVKFMIETGEYGIALVEFEELTPLLKISNK